MEKTLREMRNIMGLHTALEELEKAMQKVNEYSFKVEDVNEFIIEKYPYSKSFDEVAEDTSEWVESAKEKITKKYMELYGEI